MLQLSLHTFLFATSRPIPWNISNYLVFFELFSVLWNACGMKYRKLKCASATATSGCNIASASSSHKIWTCGFCFIYIAAYLIAKCWHCCWWLLSDIELFLQPTTLLLGVFIIVDYRIINLASHCHKQFILQ